jgi:hypothetical protein
VKKTIAVDFDKVIHAYSRGWQNGVIYDEPMPGAFDALRKLREEYNVYIFTTRQPDGETVEGDLEGPVVDGQHDAIRQWFCRHGGEDLANLPITNRKVIAVLYIDDRAVRFTNWQEAMFAIRVLEPPE